MLVSLQRSPLEPFRAVSAFFPAPQGLLQKADRFCLGIANCIAKPIEKRLGWGVPIQTFLAKVIPVTGVTLYSLGNAVVHFTRRDEAGAIASMSIMGFGMVFLMVTELIEHDEKTLSRMRFFNYGTSMLHAAIPLMLGTATGHFGLGALGAGLVVMNASAGYLRATRDLPAA